MKQRLKKPWVEPADDNNDLSESGMAATSSAALEEVGPQNSTKIDAEVEGAVGGAATSSTALEDHAIILMQCRQDARGGQEKSRAEMLWITRAKLVLLVQNNGVLVPVSDFDRGRLDSRNDLQQVGTKHGTISTMVSRN